jgi:sugar transferase EpsL
VTTIDGRSAATFPVGSGPHARRVKRWLDILLASAGLVLLSPVLLGTALVIRMKMGQPIFFRQVRPGLHAQPITVLKFRTMARVDTSGSAAATREPQITRLGAFLRRTSIDEVPQLWNVLRGDMSIVGPRPLLMEWLPAYTERQARRHDVRPGLTGWAQVNGRNDIPYSRRIELDVWYVEHWSIWLDLWILVRTPFAVLSMRGSRAVEDRRALDDIGLFAAAERDARGSTGTAPDEYERERTP